MRNPRTDIPWSVGRVARRHAYECWINSPDWRRKRRAWHHHWTAQHQHEPVCVICGRRWTMRDDLHHRTYSHVGSERPDELAPCHRACHEAIHALLETHPAWRRLTRPFADDLAINLLRRTAHPDQPTP